MRRAAYLLTVLAVSLSLVMACGRKPKVIPESTFVKIYEDMFLSDQWLVSHPDERKIADTTWFYDPIFERYGYTKQDYYASVAHYLQEPEKYADIFREVTTYFETEAAVLSEKLAQEYAPKKTKPTCIAPLFGEVIEKFESMDSIWVERDEKGFFKPQMIQFDTIFSGPKIIVRKKAQEAVVDSLATQEPELVEELASQNKISPLDQRRNQKPMKIGQKPSKNLVVK